MKFSCTKENLYKTLSLVVAVAGKNINLPILGNVLIKVEEQKVEIIATNLEVAITANLRSKVEESGAFTVPGKTLLDFVNLMTEEKVEIEIEENELKIVCGKSSTKIKGTPAEDFPVIPKPDEGKGYSVEIERFKNGLSQVLPAVSKNDIRPELSGVYLGFNTERFAGLVMAATDSYRLAEKKIVLSQGVDVFTAIIPGRTAQELNRIVSILSQGEEEKNIRILINENQVVFNYGNAQLISRLVEGQYPDYTQIIPTEFKTTAEFSKNNMIKEIKAASIFTTTGVNAVSLDMNVASGTIGVSSTSTQTGEYLSEVVSDVRGEENSILLNHRYVLDGLNNLDGEVCIMKVVNADSPCLLLPKDKDDYLYIVMPIRQ